MEIWENPNVKLKLNGRRDLMCFQDERFDPLNSLVSLQHMQWTLTAGSIREFARVCAPDRIVAFQLPARLVRANCLSRFRRAILDYLPFGLARLYRRWRHGHETVFDMYYTPRTTVVAKGSDAGFELVHCEPDSSAGTGTEGFLYLFRKARETHAGCN